MIVKKLYFMDIPSFNAEDDAQVPGYLHRPLTRPIALERMQIKAGQTHLTWVSDLIKPSQNTSDLVHPALWEPSLIVALKSALEPL